MIRRNIRKMCVTKGDRESKGGETSTNSQQPGILCSEIASEERGEKQGEEGREEVKGGKDKMRELWQKEQTDLLQYGRLLKVLEGVLQHLCLT